MPHRLDEDLRCQILADYLDGVPVRDLRLKYGVSETYPGMLARRGGFPLRDPEKSRATTLALHERKQRIAAGAAGRKEQQKEYARKRLRKRFRKRAGRDWLIVSTVFDNAWRKSNP